MAELRTLYDSTAVADIPADPSALVAGYTSGYWPTYPALAGAFPGQTEVSIAVNAAHDAQVLDVETGDASPGEAPAWAARQRAAGRVPAIYTNLSTLPAVVAAFNSAGMPQPLYWLADYTNEPHICSAACAGHMPAGWSWPGPITVVATQYGGDLAGHYDQSAVVSYWPGVDDPNSPAAMSAGATPIPTANAQEDEDMKLIGATDTFQQVGQGMCYAITGLTYSYIGDPEFLRAMQPTCGDVVNMAGADVFRHMQQIDANRAVLFGDLNQSLLADVQKILDAVAADATQAEMEQAIKDAWASVTPASPATAPAAGDAPTLDQIKQVIDDELVAHAAPAVAVPTAEEIAAADVAALGAKLAPAPAAPPAS